MSEKTIANAGIQGVDSQTDEHVMQVHLTGPEYGEFEFVVEVEVDVDELDGQMDGENASLIFTKGGDTITIPEDTFAYQTGENLSRTIITDEPTALSYFLFALETRIGGRYTEEDVIDSIDIPDGLDLTPFYEWHSELSPTDRRLRLIDLWEERIERGDWLSEKYMDEWDTEFRQTGLSGDTRALAEKIAESVERRPTLCYWTAQHAAMEFQDTGRVEYVEGLVLPKQASHAVRHAWIEVDGQVVELTWPWHDLDGSGAVYQGVSIPINVVRKQRENHEQGGPAILNEKGKRLMNLML